jgi:hypothetical protein
VPAEVAVGELQDALEVAEVGPLGLGQHGEDAQADALVHHLVEAQRGVGLPIRDCRRWGSPVPPAQDGAPWPP